MNSYRKNQLMTEGFAILPIGAVNTFTGSNSEFGTIWNCWEEDSKSYNYLVERNGKYLILHSSCALTLDIDMKMTLFHDQTCRIIGDWASWKLVAIASHTAAGLQKLGQIACKKRIRTYTFK